jgi:hypothetical protein
MWHGRAAPLLHFSTILVRWATLTVAKMSNYSSEERLVASVWVTENCWRVGRRLILSDPMSDLVRHYGFPVPDAFLDL